MTEIHLFSGGAAQGLVTKLETSFTQKTGCSIKGNFGAVGLMKDRLLKGDRCDVLILSQKLIDELIASGHVKADSARPLGIVQTGIAVKDGAVIPVVSDRDSLKSSLESASEIYFPDPNKATAGIHFMSVLRALGIDASVADKLRPFPNGATAMREMAHASESNVIGCTQVSEIIFTPGVQLVAPLPPEFALATTYTAAISTQASEPALAARLIAHLVNPEARETRRAAGLE